MALIFVDPEARRIRCALRRRHRVLAVLVCWLACNAIPAARAACTCGPDFYQDDSRIASAFAVKRRSLAATGYPERLLKLFDRAPRCVAAAERAPDGFTLLRVTPSGNKDARAWTQAAEDTAHADVLNGTLRSYHIMNVRRTFACCQEPDYTARPDYDRDLDLNTSGAINCRKSGAAGSCQ